MRIFLLADGLSYGMGIHAGVLRYSRAGPRWKLVVASWHGAQTDLGGLAECVGFIGLVRSARILDAVLAAGLPAVNVAGEWETPAIATVTTDNHAAGRLAAGHLLGLGVQRLVFHGNEAPYWLPILHGMRTVLRARHPRAAVECWSEPGFDLSGSGLRERLLAAGSPVGVLCRSDQVAARLVDACWQAGIHVPGEVAVLGLGDDPEVCRLSEPTLSSVTPDAEGIGFQAARVLDLLMDGRSVPQPSPSLAPLGISQRGSTDPASTPTPELAEALRFIRATVGRGIKVPDVVRAVRSSRKSLERRFREHLATTPAAEIRRARLELSRRLLADPALSIRQVALRSGYRTAAQFSNLFTREFGRSPSRFRQESGR